MANSRSFVKPVAAQLQQTEGLYRAAQVAHLVELQRRLALLETERE